MSRTAKKTMKTIELAPEMKIHVKPKAENTFREGTAVYKRVQAVLSCNNKPVEVARKKGARASTIRYLARAKVITLSAAR